ncbi:hypothetical protein NIES267_26330 [Calothrix parasitica NIES-267]|uniref:DUF4114 domain-containing protein n=1 Tax=Calothrix parasitica NIES-267 TaxID=1973488 RepID=A0A1Z4LPJ1_9CYAN|nr:hypothetical protein NIES267_26330 [Calothrix parasitica NIES-267]
MFKKPHLSLFVGVVIGGIFSVFSSPAQAQTPAPIQVQSQEFFDNSGVLFTKNTVVQFKFVRSYGAYQSVFGVRNETTGQETDLIGEVKPSDLSPSQFEQALNKPSDGLTDNPNDFQGTLGNAVPLPGTAQFIFKAGNRYSFYLKSQFKGRNVGVVYSTDAKNFAGNQQAKFIGGFSALANGGVTIRWDDTNSQIPRVNQNDNDFDDFIIKAGGHEECLDKSSK